MISLSFNQIDQLGNVPNVFILKKLGKLIDQDIDHPLFQKVIQSLKQHLLLKDSIKFLDTNLSEEEKKVIQDLIPKILSEGINNFLSEDENQNKSSSKEFCY